jgi:hypothetical protein
VEHNFEIFPFGIPRMSSIPLNIIMPQLKTVRVGCSPPLNPAQVESEILTARKFKKSSKSWLPSSVQVKGFETTVPVLRISCSVSSPFFQYKIPIL